MAKNLKQEKIIAEQYLNKKWEGEEFYDSILKKITDREYFTYVRQAHAIWDVLARLKVKQRPKNLVPFSKGVAKYINENYPILTTPNVVRFHFESMYLANSLGNNYYVAAGNNFSWIKSQMVNEEYFKMYKIFFPINYRYYDALLWKKAVHRLRFLELLDGLKNMHVIIISPEPEYNNRKIFVNFSKVFGWKKYSHIAIHPCRAAMQYDDIEKKILSFNNLFAEEDKCFLLYCGGLISNALGRRLHKQLNRSFMIDLGIAFEILLMLYFNNLAKKDWIRPFPQIRKWYEQQRFFELRGQ